MSERFSATRFITRAPVGVLPAGFGPVDILSNEPLCTDCAPIVHKQRFGAVQRKLLNPAPGSKQQSCTGKKRGKFRTGQGKARMYHLSTVLIHY